MYAAIIERRIVATAKSTAHVRKILGIAKTAKFQA